MLPSAIGHKTLTLLKKYGPFLCLPIFLMMAYSYTSKHQPQYKATAKIELNGIAADEAMADIKSKYLVQKALNQLRFGISYYAPKNANREINGDTLPVKISFSRLNADDDVLLEFKGSGAGTFTITHGDTIAYEEFNKSLKESYGAFSVTHGSDLRYQNANFLFRPHDPNRLIEQYYDALEVQPAGRGNTLSVSVLSGTPKKSADFTNKLLHLYALSRHKPHATKIVNATPSHVSPLKKQIAGDPEKIAKNITMLREKAARLKHQVALLTPKPKKAEPDTEMMTAYSDLQLKLFKQIMPYLRRDIDQFVQVPYIDEVYDVELKNELRNYNAIQLRKQRFLADPARNNVPIDTLNKKLMFLQSEIVQNITFLQQQHTPEAVAVKDHSPLLRVKRDSFARVEKEITDLKQQYAAMRRTVPAKPVSVAPQPKLRHAPDVASVVVLSRPESNIEFIKTNTAWIYIIAVLAGLLIPLTWLVIYNNRTNARLARRANTQTIAEKLNDLFAVKQID